MFHLLKIAIVFGSLRLFVPQPSDNDIGDDAETYQNSQALIPNLLNPRMLRDRIITFYHFLSLNHFNTILTVYYPRHYRVSNRPVWSVQTFGEGCERLCKGGYVGVQDRQLAFVYILWSIVSITWHNYNNKYKYTYICTFQRILHEFIKFE